MEKVPYRPKLDGAPGAAAPVSMPEAPAQWRTALPVLRGKRVVLRELCQSDAVSLHALLTAEEVARFTSLPPTTVEGFEKFIAWCLRQRAAGEYVCFAVTLQGFDTAIGIFQLKYLRPGIGTPEWGFSIGSAFWGTGVFEEASQLVLEFAFNTVGIERLEARAAVQNGRGNGALKKVGAVQEGILRKSLLRDGCYLDQALYAIIGDEWRALRDAVSTPRLYLH